MRKYLNILITIILFAILGVMIWQFPKITNKLQRIFGREETSSGDLANSVLSGKLFGPKDQAPKQLDPKEIIKWTNQYRTENGLSPLTENSLLSKAAEQKSADMFEYQYFEHVSPSGITPAELVLSVGYNYKYSGENLALGGFKDEKELVDAWMNSPGHRANILNINYTEIGVAADLGSYENESAIISVQEFGQPAPNCPPPDAKLAKEIKDDKSQYQTNIIELDQLASDVQALYDAANELVKEGNTASAAKDQATAEAKWAEADQKRSLAQAKQNEYNQLKAQADQLLAQINLLVVEYNKLVGTYNQCIK